MEIAMGAIGPLLPKFGDLLVGEFTLERRLRKGIESLVTELTLMHAALRKVAKVPPERLDEGVKIWAGKVKELSYQMEDIIDSFMVRVEDHRDPTNPKNRVKKVLKKTINLFKKGKDLHRIYDDLEEAVGQAKQLAELRQRYEQDIRYTGSDVSNDNASVSIDPRVMALYTDVKELVGIEETRDMLINILLEGDDWSKNPLKTISIVGFGGLGKTTLAKVTYDNIKVQFDCHAFVSVSQNPDIKEVLKDILYELDKNKFADIHNAKRDERQLIDMVGDFLTNKRYIIVMDDIWDEKVWQLIKCAFPKKSPGSRLITTTRKVSVSKACCSCSYDIYRMKPLSQNVSRKLFHKRVFSHERGCPRELVQVSEDILQKCGGIPLAIVTIASLLASNRHIKANDQWYELLNSIGRGLTEDRSVEEMNKILLFSYYDLPSYLKPCLLYLSIFPEDHKIMRDKLVWKWISEGFVYSEKQETSLYELGDSYFNELVNRSMIQPIGIDDEEKVEACSVHDMVLDLICSLSIGQNFVTVLDGTERKMANSQSKVHILSIQDFKVNVATTRMARVRSLTVCPNIVVSQVLDIPNFPVLRVLDLEGCPISDIGYVGSLLHLRYLGLKDTNLEKIPVDICKLRFLQTMDLRNTRIKELPSSVVRLRHLMCLFVDNHMELPPGIGNLTSLEVLDRLKKPRGNLNLHIVKELGHLTKLRVVRFEMMDLSESMNEAFVESLNNLHNLESLYLNALGGLVDLTREVWVPPRQLRRLICQLQVFPFLKLPAWINPSSLPLLSYLDIWVHGVQPQDIQLLGMLPALRYLGLGDDDNFSGQNVVQMYVVTADGFPCATQLCFTNIAAVPSIFPEGAAPRLEQLEFAFPATWVSRGGFDLGMGHLPSLEIVSVNLFCIEASEQEMENAEAALIAAEEDHPNRPFVCARCVLRVLAFRFGCLKNLTNETEVLILSTD
ncbi:disease resistance protein PIK6-NP-like [Lolium rigidum]|uniref:disease resistance protein PIK6-NP-like n=1 Tax=Lolium rigidum TaxID=89674 RepID=UPI001F5C3694|nr:disease resistance protein PIK6-NP-like [Lolium rigidum]